MRTVGWLLFSPLVVITLIKKSVPEERLLNVNVLHIKKKNSRIKTFSSETFGKLPSSHPVYRENFTYKSCGVFIVYHRNNLLCFISINS